MRSLIMLFCLSSCASAAELVAQVADGAGWKTIFMLTNLTNSPHRAQVDFWSEQGTPLALPVPNIRSALGKLLETTTYFWIDLPPHGSAVVETTGAAASVSVGYATFTPDVENSYSSSASVSLKVIFRQTVPGRPDFEASIPTDPYAWRQVFVPFDNTAGFATGLAVVNGAVTSSVGGTGLPAIVEVTAWDERGQLLLLTGFLMKPFAHTSFSLADRYPETRGRRGTVELRMRDANAGGIGALALRFNPGGAFASVQPIGMD